MNTATKGKGITKGLEKAVVINNATFKHRRNSIQSITTIFPDVMHLSTGTITNTTYCIYN